MSGKSVKECALSHIEQNYASRGDSTTLATTTDKQTWTTSLYADVLTAVASTHASFYSVSLRILSDAEIPIPRHDDSKIKMNVIINNANLYYEIHGRGEPLLMLQGWGMDLTGWQYVLEPLSQEFQLILLDNRGTGRSEVTPGEYTTRGLADDAAGLLDHLQLDSSHVLGWSMGGMIAQELALAYPRKVKRLILSASSAKVTAKSSFIAWSNVEAINRRELQTSVNWQLSFCFSKAVFANEAMLFEIRENALNPPYPVTVEGLVNQFAAVASHDRRRQLRSIKSPTLVLGAAEDGIIDTDQVKALALEIDDSQLRILPGGHMFHIEHSELFARTVIEFLKDPAYAK